MTISKCLNIDNSDALKKVLGVFATEPYLAHVGYVKQTNTFAAVQVLVDPSKRVADGHVVTCEGYNTSFHGILVEVIESCFLELSSLG